MLISGVAGGVAGTMTPVSLVLFARHVTGSFAAASFVLGAATVGALTTAPLRGRFVDRFGPSRTLLLLALVTAVVDALFITLGELHAPTATLVLLSLLGGATGPPTGAALRNAWRQLLDDPGDLHAVYALLSMLQEVNFFTGPLLAGLLIAVASPTAAVATAAGLGLAGAILFATSTVARAYPRRREPSGGLGALRSPGLRTVVICSGWFGAAFGILDVSLPAFAQRHGSPAAAGLLLSALAAGIGVGSFFYGLRPLERRAGALYPPLCALAAAGLLPAVAADSVPGLIGLMVFAGLCFAPISTSQIAVIDEVASEGTRTEAMTWLGTAYGAASAAGAVVAGRVIEGPGVRTALFVAGAAAFAAFLTALARRRLLRPAIA